jgi:hypothetical protein
MHHGPTELDDTLIVFEELEVSIVDFDGRKCSFTGDAKRSQ